MKTHLLIASFVIAKVCGIIGVIALFARLRALAGSLLLVDGIILFYIIVASYKAIKIANDAPCPNAKPYLW